jgi:hypothetical protein
MANSSALESESDLLARAGAFPEFAELAQLTPETLREINAREGVDFATALLFDRVKNSPKHASFIMQMDRWQSDNHKFTTDHQTTVGIVPAAFYKENPNSGADGRLVREEAGRLGIRCELVPLSSTGTLAQNTKSILDWLAAHRSERIILISLCKGGADVKFAMLNSGSPKQFKDVFAWINICGTLSGSPVAEWLLATPPRYFAAWIYCKCLGHNLAALREIATSPHNPLSAPLQLPESVRLISLVGFPLRRHLTNRFMRHCHQHVSRKGPTDGGLLLGDACRLPGVLYPIWGADHYLRPERRARQIITAAFKFLLADYRPAGRGSTNEIPAIDRTVQTPLA